MGKIPNAILRGDYIYLLVYTYLQYIDIPMVYVILTFLIICPECMLTLLICEYSEWYSILHYYYTNH